MASKSLSNRQQSGFFISIIVLIAGLTGFVYQFMPDGTFLTFFVCGTAIGGLVNNGSGLDERESQLLLQSYGSAFKYLFAAILFIYIFSEFSGWLNIAGPIIGVINSHWIGIMAASMCIFLGIIGMRNFREIR